MHRAHGRPEPGAGANRVLEQREAQALSALARQLTPQADERGTTLTSRAFALFVFTLLLCAVAPAAAFAQSPATGGTAYEPPAPPTPTTPVPLPQSVLPRLSVPGVQAQLMPNGLAAAPADAPPPVQNAVWAANELQQMPYKYG